MARACRATAGALATLRRQRDRLLQAFLADSVTVKYFGEQERKLSAKIAALEADSAEALEHNRNTTALVDAFERAAALLRDPAFDFDAIWRNASDRERRVLVEELIEAVTIYADRLEVTAVGAPPLIVRPEEVGLRGGWYGNSGVGGGT